MNVLFLENKIKIHHQLHWQSTTYYTNRDVFIKTVSSKYPSQNTNRSHLSILLRVLSNKTFSTSKNNFCFYSMWGIVGGNFAKNLCKLNSVCKIFYYQKPRIAQDFSCGKFNMKKTLHPLEFFKFLFSLLFHFDIEISTFFNCNPTRIVYCSMSNEKLFENSSTEQVPT